MISRCQDNTFLPIEDAIIGVILNGHALSQEEFKIKENLLKELHMNVITYCDELFSNNILLRYDEEQIYPAEQIVELAAQKHFYD